MDVSRPPGTMSCKAASDMLGITQHRVWMEAAAGLIRAVVIPGYPLLLDRESVEGRAAVLRPKPKPKPAGKGKRRPDKAAST